MRIDFSEQAELDLDRIFDHLFASHIHFGHEARSSARLARDRVLDIAKECGRIAVAPHRGRKHTIKMRKIRHLTLNRAIYWFTVDETAQIVRIEGVFLRGEDHFQRIFNRLTEEGEAD